MAACGICVQEPVFNRHQRALPGAHRWAAVELLNGMGPDNVIRSQPHQTGDKRAVMEKVSGGGLFG